MQLLLDHPRVREAQRVHLRTRDAQPFYKKFGFSDEVALPGTELVLTR